MVILGIDPGFGRLGYAVIETNSGKTKVFECDCLETSAKTDYEKRLLLIADKITNLIAKYRPQVMAIEKIFFAANQKTAFRIAEVRGMLIYLAAINKISVAEYTPLQVKMALCGYGRASKEQVQKMLKNLLQIESLPKLDDASDALAVGFTCSICRPK